MRIVVIILLLLPGTAYCQLDNCYYLKLWRIGINEQNMPDSVKTRIGQLNAIEQRYPHPNAALYAIRAKLCQKIDDDSGKIQALRTYLLKGGEIKDLQAYYLSPSEIGQLTDWFRQTVLPGRNTTYIQLIDQLTGFDQYSRKILNRKNDAFFTEYLDRVDSFTAISLKQAFEKYGFPKRSEIGNSTYSDLFTLLLHVIADYPALYMYFEDKLRKAVLSGDLDPENYAAIIDRYQLNNAKTGQLYGCYNIGTNGNFAEIKDIETVDSRRNSIGLPPLEEVTKFPPYSRYKLPSRYLPNTTDASLILCGSY